jgi:processive 1,2-diacylglycerol beta-glucosyltransferase
MKIIVVYATAGAGHKKAAQVIAGFIRQQAQAHTVVLADIVDNSSWIFRLMYLFGYDFLVNHARWIWSFLFYLTSHKAGRSFFSYLTTIVHYYNTKSFSEFLIKEEPDVVVSTHFLSSDIVAYMKRKGLLRSKLITVVTDFGVHPFWVSESTDLYCVASEATKVILAGQGVAPKNITVTGIPTDPKFSQPHDRQRISYKLGIDSRRKVVLIVTGSFGIGPIREITAALHSDYEVLAVCARNKKLYDDLSARAFPNTHVFGFVDNIDELMAVSDVIITKPGGLTISELLCMDLMPIFISAIPGQETGNIECLRNAGIGRELVSLKNAAAQVAEYILDAQNIKDAIRRFKQTNAVSKIYDSIRTDSPGPAR